MSQYSLGSVSVTNGSAVVTGVGTFWAAALATTQLFALKGEFVFSNILTVDSDTQITLASPYVGTTKTGVSYVVQRDFTPTNNYPIPSFGDSGTAPLNALTLLELDAQVAALSVVTQAINGNIFVSGAITLESSTVAGLAVSGSTLDSTPIGATTPAAGAFTALSASSLNVSGSDWHTNRIINGGFEIWQMGTSFTIANGAGQYTADQ